MHPYSVKLLKAERAACSSPLNSIVPPLAVHMPYMYIYVCSSTYFVHSITAASALGGAHAVTARRARATTLFTSLWQIISSPLQPFGLVPSATVLCGGGDGGGGSYQRRLWLKPMYAGP